MAGMDPRRLALCDEAATLALGAALGRAVAAIFSEGDGRTGEDVFLLLRGDLGSGKTTLVRGLVAALPGGEAARVASPSFNLANVYPTGPEVLHVDLYRLEGFGAREALWEALGDDPAGGSGGDRAAPRLAAVEWAQYLGAEELPGERIELDWRPCPSGRLLDLSATGRTAREVLAAALSAYDGRAVKGSE